MGRKKITDIGLDLGFGNVKVVSKHGKLIFPSVAGRAREVRFGQDVLSKEYPNEQISHEDGDWFVGNLALGHLRAANQRRLRGRTSRGDESGMNFRILMMKTALAKMFPNELNGDAVHIRIVTGLPVNHMGQASSLKQALLGQHHVHTDCTHFVANVDEVVVMPEPRGTLFAFMATDKGKVNKEYIARTTVVFNGGEVTNDVQFDRDGEFVDEYSQSSQTGHYLALEQLQSMYEARYNETPDIARLREILHDRSVNISGDSTSFYDEVEIALQPVRDGARQLLEDTIEAGTSVDTIIVSGGIAMTSFEYIKGLYKQSICSKNPLYDTAQGYYNYSRMKWG